MGQSRFSELDVLLNDSTTKMYFSYKIKTQIYFLEKKFGTYYSTILNQFVHDIESSGFFAAFLILVCWILFLRQIDVYEKEKWRYILLTCLLGMFFTFAAYFLYDAFRIYFHFELNGSVVHDFLYCIFGIGIIEEIVKFIPLLIILAFTDEINEPIDYIVYASVSALGFAFVENLMYFNEGSLFIIHGRALSAVITHMFDASVIAYGLILNKYKHKGNIFTAFFLSYLVAAFMHGFYDFWLLNKSVSDLSIITIVFMIFTFVWYHTLIANALNNSPFFDKDKIINAQRLKDYLLYALSSVLALEYIILSMKFGPTVGNIGFIASIISGSFLIFFLAKNLSSYHVAKNEWRPLMGRTFLVKNNPQSTGTVETEIFGQQLIPQVAPSYSFGIDFTEMFSAQGRISRASYWIRSAITFVIIAIVEHIAGEASATEIIIRLLILIFMTMQGIKRMHDVDKNGWYSIVPFYNIYLCLTDGTVGKNMYGEDPNNRD